MAYQAFTDVRAREQSEPYSEIRVMNPSRGLNLLGADAIINDKEASAGTKNIEFIETGAFQKRMGYASRGTGLISPLRGLGQHVSESGGFPLGADGGVIKKYVSSVWTALSGTYTMSASADITFTSLAEKTYAWDGINGGVVFDGSVVTQPGTMPRAKQSIPYKGWHVAFGVNGQPYRLYFAPSVEPSRFTYDPSNATADTNDIDLVNATEVPGATVFTGTATPRAIDINKIDGQKVIGLGYFQDVLIVFKERSIFQLYFNDSNGFVVERITDAYGCVAPGSIKTVENDCYFMSENGIFVLGNEPNYYASIRTNELSSRVRTLFDQIPAASRYKCRAIYYDNRYWLTVPQNTTSVNALIIYDRRFYAWMLWDNIYANTMLYYTDTLGANHFYFADDTKATLQEFTPGIFNDNGVAINAVFRTRAYEAKYLDREKFWYQFRPIFRQANGTVNISYYTEDGQIGQSYPISGAPKGGLGYDQIGALLFGTSLSDTYSDADLGFVSGSFQSTSTDSSNLSFVLGAGFNNRTFKVEFSNANLNENFIVLGWAILYQIKDAGRTDAEYTYR